MGRDTSPLVFPVSTLRRFDKLSVWSRSLPRGIPTQIQPGKSRQHCSGGNTVVWKPAGDIPAISFAFAQVFHDAGMPAGVFNMVLAPGSVAQSLVDDPRIAGITFTGSVGVGKQIADSATQRGVKVQLELGGNNAAIVMPDTDPQFAAQQLLIGAMSGSGQKCTATRRIITVGGIRESFIEHLTAGIESLIVGDGTEPTTTTGPVISERAKAEIESAVSDAIAEGGRIVAQAKIPEGDGFYVAPTVIEGTMNLRTCKEEVFGPVTTLLHAESLTEAIEMANATEFGLTASIFSSNDADIAQANPRTSSGPDQNQTHRIPGRNYTCHSGDLKTQPSLVPREQNAESVSEFFTVTKSCLIAVSHPER